MTRNALAPDPLVSTFGRLLEATQALTRHVTPDFEAAGLDPTWFEVLLRLSRSEGGFLSMGELSRQIALTSGGVTRLVDRMSAAGLVERQPCASDRRVLYAVLTDKGRATLEPTLEAHSRTLAALFDGWSAHDLGELDALLDRLRDLPAIDPV